MPAADGLQRPFQWFGGFSVMPPAESDEKTKEGYERQIKWLQTQVRNPRAKVKAIAKADELVFSSEDRRFALALFHSDRFKPAKRDQAQRVFQLLNNIPVLPREDRAESAGLAGDTTPRKPP